MSEETKCHYCGEFKAYISALGQEWCKHCLNEFQLWTKLDESMHCAKMSKRARKKFRRQFSKQHWERTTAK